MAVTPLKLITIIGEGVLEERLCKDVTRLGAKGYTITDVRGQGHRGLRSGEFIGRNIKLETVVSPAVADAILAHLATDYFPHYAVIAYAQPADVVRGDKYV